MLYNAHGHKLRFPTFEKAQFVTALGIEPGCCTHSNGWQTLCDDVPKNHQNGNCFIHHFP